MYRMFALGVAAAALLASSPVSAHSHKKKSLEIVHPWTRATTDSVATVVVRMTIRNRGAAAERLVGASTPLAAKVEIVDAGGGPAGAKPAGLVIAAGSALDLKRNGPHLRLTGVKRRLDPYESFALTLLFAKTGKVVVEVAVQEPEEQSNAQ